MFRRFYRNHQNIKDLEVNKRTWPYSLDRIMDESFLTINIKKTSTGHYLAHGKGFSTFISPKYVNNWVDKKEMALETRQKELEIEFYQLGYVFVSVVVFFIIGVLSS